MTLRHDRAAQLLPAHHERDARGRGRGRGREVGADEQGPDGLQRGRVRDTGGGRRGGGAIDAGAVGVARGAVAAVRAVHVERDRDLGERVGEQRRRRS